MTLTGFQFAIENGLIDPTSIPSAEELQDQSKSSSLITCLALIQMMTSVVQLISRKVSNLPSTQLEVVTLAYCVIAFGTYILCWSWPKDVRTARILKCSRPVTSTEVRNLRQDNTKWTRLDKTVLGFKFEMDVLFPGAAACFGALHCLAWNSEYPTRVEQLMWRIASVVATVALVPFAIPKVFSSERVEDLFDFTTLAIYALVRLFLIVETFRTLFYQPPDAFKTTWTVNVPGLS